MDVEKYKKRILKYIDLSDDCWVWKGSKNSDGYGNFWIEDKCLKAHRASYEIFKGPIVHGYYVCHSCDNPACVNPDHLWIGTQLENMKDMKKKGRSCRAEDMKHNKIPPSLRKEILDQYLSGNTQASLAKKYNCHPSAIWSAIHKFIPAGPLGFKGEDHPLAKLKEDDVRNIRKLSATGFTRRELSDTYNVTPCMIKRIVTRIAWKHVE